MANESSSAVNNRYNLFSCDISIRVYGKCRRHCKKAIELSFIYSTKFQNGMFNLSIFVSMTPLFCMLAEHYIYTSNSCSYQAGKFYGSPEICLIEMVVPYLLYLSVKIEHGFGYNGNSLTNRYKILIVTSPRFVFFRHAIFSSI